MDPNSFKSNECLFHTLYRFSIPVEYGANCSLFRQGDHPTGLYLVCQGEASLVMFSSVESIIGSFSAGPGSILGLPAVVSKESYTLSAIVRKGSVIRFVDMTDFENILAKDPTLYPSVLSLLAAEVRAARALLSGSAKGISPFTMVSQYTVTEMQGKVH
ncbi:MAG TPA: cyclic nucleotide-binding domain-containing protein [Terracidiphilus sp.]|jgi:CRP-like cAMP-binding protein|nr:cyclic nucleotide-binding domain-containing protein [Terracidiphilus sp.]